MNESEESEQTDDGQQDEPTEVPRNKKGQFTKKEDDSQSEKDESEVLHLADLIGDLQDITGIEDNELEDFSSNRSKFDFLKHQAKQLRKGKKKKTGNKPITGRPTGTPKDPLMDTLKTVIDGNSMTWQFDPKKLMKGGYMPKKGDEGR